MTLPRLALTLACLAAPAAASAAWQYAPPKSLPPEKDVRKAIEVGTDRLSHDLATLRSKGVHDPSLADIEVFLKAARWVVRHDEFYHKDSAGWTLKVLERGLLR